MKKMLDKRGCRKMLVTTLGRIERLEDAIRMYSRPDDDYYTPERCAEIVERCREDIVKEKAKLKHYNDMAAKIIAEERNARR